MLKPKTPATLAERKAAARQALKDAIQTLARSQWGNVHSHHATSSGEETEKS